MFPFRIVPAGDSALIVQLPQEIDPALNDWCIALARAVERRCGSAIRDAVVGYCSVTVYFDPLLIDAGWLEDQISTAAAGLREFEGSEGSLVEIPVCYGGDFGPDLDDVARFGSCSHEDVIALHAASIYRVYLVGFVPGFAYMAEVDRRIAAPRRSAPRTVVPAGSVAIAGGQTGVYPAVTPGGWNIIGRTPMKPFDPTRAEPFLFKAGDRVRFHRIGVDQYAAWQ
jgi:inhibitor of KinA